MSDNSFSVHMSYASVDRSDGGDPRPESRSLLSELRVVSALRDATAPWTEGQEAVVTIAMTEEATVLTLSEQDSIETVLTAQALRDAFSAAGMTLWLSVGDDDESDDESEISAEDTDAAVDEFELGEADEFDESELESMFDEESVRVAAFSRRGLMTARFLAESVKSTVDYVEAGTWSLCRYATTESTDMLDPTRGEAPVIELNQVDGTADWIEVHLPGFAAPAVPFWVQAERDTQPIIDPETITVPETKEIFCRLITEGDGSRDELSEIAASVSVDVDAAHRALAPESLGGVVGAEARTIAFLAAFQVPAELIDLALDDDVSRYEERASHLRIEPQGWVRGIGDAIIGGYEETLPLTHRDRWDARLSRALRARPLLATALYVGELVLGVLATRKLRGGWKSIGVMLVIDAVAELVIAAVRRKRRR